MVPSPVIVGQTDEEQKLIVCECRTIRAMAKNEEKTSQTLCWPPHKVALQSGEETGC